MFLSLKVFKITNYLISSHIYYEYVFLFVFVLFVFSNSVVALIHLITDPARKECLGPQGPWPKRLA